MTTSLPPPATGAGPVASLDEVRRRLAGLDNLPLEQHPEEFAAVDGLLRAALDGDGLDRAALPTS